MGLIDAITIIIFLLIGIRYIFKGNYDMAVIVICIVNLLVDTDNIKEMLK